MHDGYSELDYKGRERLGHLLNVSRYLSNPPLGLKHTHTHKHIANIWYIFRDLHWLLYLLICHAHDMKDINNRRVWHFGFKTFANFLRVAVSEKIWCRKKSLEGFWYLTQMGPPKISVFFRLPSFLSGCKCFLYFSSLFGELLSVHPIPTHFALLPITDIFSSLIPQKISFLLFTDIFHRFSRFHGYIPLWLYEVAKLSFLGFGVLWVGVKRLCSMRK